MKRPAIGFCLCLSILCWGSVGQTKGKSGGSKAEAPAADSNAAPAEGAAADSNAAPAADSNAAPAEAAPAEGGAPSEGEVTPEGEAPGATPIAKGGTPTTLSWQDIIVVPRK